MRPRRFRNIAVGVDLAGRADEAIRVSVALRNKLGATLHLVHASPKPSMVQAALDPEATDEVTISSVLAAHSALRQRLSGALGLGPVEDILEVVPGDPARVMAEYARDHDLDLVVVGPHDPDRFEWQDTARDLSTVLPCALWDQPTTFQGVRRILVPTDFSEESLAALDFARTLAQAFGARITVLHACDPHRPGASHAWNAIVPLPDEELLTDDGSPVDVIRSHAARADLVILSTHGRRGLARVIFGNVALALLRDPPTAVLAIPHNREAHNGDFAGA